MHLYSWLWLMDYFKGKGLFSSLIVVLEKKLSLLAMLKKELSLFGLFSFPITWQKQPIAIVTTTPIEKTTIDYSWQQQQQQQQQQHSSNNSSLIYQLQSGFAFFPIIHQSVITTRPDLFSMSDLLQLSLTHSHSLSLTCWLTLSRSLAELLSRQCLISLCLL